MATNKLAPKAAKAKASSPVTTAYPVANSAQDRKYRAEDALRTITRADEIKKDRALMGDVRKLANEQMKTLASVAGKPKR